MVDNHGCRCLICKTEKELTHSFSYQSGEVFRQLTKPYAVLASFPSPLDLVSALHRQRKEAQLRPTPDQILMALLRLHSAAHSGGQLVPSILTLAFVPALHKLSRELSVWFPTLPRQDIAQQTIANFLELTRSNAITSRKGYLSFAIVRELRRVTFRWATRESRITLTTDQSLQPSHRIEEPIYEDSSESSLLLKDFLARSRRSGILSASDLEFLTKLKLEGHQAKDIFASSRASSPKAVHNRYQRIIKRLRQAASNPRVPSSEAPSRPGSIVPEDSFLD